MGDRSAKKTYYFYALALEITFHIFAICWQIVQNCAERSAFFLAIWEWANSNWCRTLPSKWATKRALWMPKPATAHIVWLAFASDANWNTRSVLSGYGNFNWWIGRALFWFLETRFQPNQYWFFATLMRCENTQNYYCFRHSSKWVTCAGRIVDACRSINCCRKTFDYNFIFGTAELFGCVFASHLAE